MKREEFEKIFEGIEFKTEIDKELLFTYLKEYAFDILIENNEVVIDDGESFLYFRNPFTGSFYNLSIIEFMQNLKAIYAHEGTDSYDDVIDIMNCVEDTCNYIYEDLYKKLIEEE